MILHLTFFVTAPPEPPTSFFVQMIEKASDKDRPALIAHLQEVSKESPRYHIQVIEGRDALLEKVRSLGGEADVLDQDLRVNNAARTKNIDVMQLKGETPQYLLIQTIHRRGLHPAIVVSMMIILVVLLTTAMSTIITYRSFGAFYKSARIVIDRIKSGEFSARFANIRNDEVGQVMSAFNQMAEEVEKYVTQIKNSESNRIRLLQELAHDLRTPISSLKNAVTTLHQKKERMSKEQEEEFFSLAIHEMDYFEKLVEDLLFLAKMSEPKYMIERSEFDLMELIGDEVKRLDSHFPNLKIEEVASITFLPFEGDRHLFQRLIRNALENAASFARHQVLIQIEHSDRLTISVRDDGPGISEQVLKDFGKRKVSRYLSSQNRSERVSVGLGSVIMQTIVDLHQGELRAFNQLNDQNEISGAVIQLDLP